MKRSKATAVDGKRGRALLAAVRALTPPPCERCSSREVAVYMGRDDKYATTMGTARALGQFARRGLLNRKVIGGYSLWSLTEKGRQAIA